jgi:hypothetical protein
MNVPSYFYSKFKRLLGDEPIGFVSSHRSESWKHGYLHPFATVAFIPRRNTTLFLTD